MPPVRPPREPTPIRENYARLNLLMITAMVSVPAPFTLDPSLSSSPPATCHCAHLPIDDRLWNLQIGFWHLVRQRCIPQDPVTKRKSMPRLSKIEYHMAASMLLSSPTVCSSSYVSDLSHILTSQLLRPARRFVWNARS